MIGAADAATLFSNVSTLLDIHKEIQAQLEGEIANFSDESQIGEVFISKVEVSYFGLTFRQIH